jgi:hypothetical protein
MIEAKESNHFSQKILDDIFKTSFQYPDRLIGREGGRLEFKQSFNWGSRDEYSKTIAAFANTKGGYIVFGIGNKPRLLIGLQNENFENLDPARVSEYLNDTFSPEIIWDIHIHRIGDRDFGLIYVEEAFEKPIISRKNIGNAIKEGEIYYRYRGRTERVKFSELRQIINDQRVKEREYWIHHIRQISKIGITNTAIFDITTGKVIGSRGSFIIDEKLLPKLRYIKEGEFKETKGAPALRLVGELQTVDSGLIQPVKTVYKNRPIRTPEIIHSFLDQEKVPDPLEYIKQICFEPSSFLPIYYFMRLAKLIKEDCLGVLMDVQSRLQSKNKLIERIETDREFNIPVPTTTYESSIKVNELKEKIINKEVDGNLQLPELKYFLKAIRTMESNEIEPTYIYPILKKIFDNFYADADANLASEIRQTICHLDIKMNKDK